MPPGKLTATLTVPTTIGARNAVVTDEGVVYLTAGPDGKIVVVTPASRR